MPPMELRIDDSGLYPGEEREATVYRLVDHPHYKLDETGEPSIWFGVAFLAFPWLAGFISGWLTVYFLWIA